MEFTSSNVGVLAEAVFDLGDMLARIQLLTQMKRCMYLVAGSQSYFIREWVRNFAN